MVRVPNRNRGAASAAVVGALVAVLLIAGFVAGLTVGYRLGRGHSGVAVQLATPVTAPAPPATLAAEPVAAPAPVQTSYPRSPIPQPGEQWDRPVPATTLIAGPAQALAPKSGEPVAWRDAAQYVGKTITVEGKVVDTHNTGEVCFLNFTPQWQGTFYVVIFKEAMGGWERPPQDYFRGRTIRVTGRVYMHKDRPQIRVNDPVQVALVR